MRILVAEDSKEIRQILSFFFKFKKHDITFVEDGVEAWEQFQNNEFDLVITDYRMPRMDGFKLLREIRNVAPNFPVVLLSADKNFENHEEAALSTVILKKPFTLAELEKSLEVINRP